MEKDKDPQAQNQAAKVIALARELYTFGQASDSEAFAVPTSGPRVARLFRWGDYSLRDALAKAFEARHGKPVSNGAIADAMSVLNGIAQDTEPQELPLRSIRRDGNLVIDMGDQSGRAIVVRAGEWEVVERSPVLFRRTRLTAALPEPERGGNLDEHLYPYINLEPEDRALAVACLLMCWWPNVTRPVIMLSGPEGTIKTITTRHMRNLVDPSTAPTRGIPERKDWEVTLASQSVIALDNLSAIPAWLSDAICRAVTGEGAVHRKLYTDSDVSAICAWRVLFMNGIDLHQQVDKTDLAGRAVTFHLPLPATYRSESEIEEAWQEAWPLALGALLDLAGEVVEALGATEASGTYRMVDFERVLMAADKVHGTEALARFKAQAVLAAEETINGSPAAAAVLRFGKGLSEPWTGSAPELGRLAGVKLSGGVMTKVSKLAPVMRRAGVKLERGKQRGAGGFPWTIGPV